jgi:HNH endonuclease
MALEPPKIIGDLALNDAGTTLVSGIIIGEGDKRRRVEIDLPPSDTPAAEIWQTQEVQPVELVAFASWAFRGKVLDCRGIQEVVSREQLTLLIKHRVLSEGRQWARIEREVRAFENLANTATARRERIPEGIRLFVWQRDDGKCVQCGSGERLEFDHIIPVIEGGSSTERNVQLLCEACNRAKGSRI